MLLDLGRKKLDRLRPEQGEINFLPLGIFHFFDLGGLEIAPSPLQIQRADPFEGFHKLGGGAEAGRSRNRVGGEEIFLE